METLKCYLVAVLVSGLVSGCSQDINIQRRYSVFIEDLFGGTSLMVKVNARGVGDLKVNSRDDNFSQAIKDQISKASGPWSEMKELVPMLSAVSISIQDPEKGFKTVYIIASDSLVFQDGESEFFYGKIDKNAWRDIWDLAAAEADRLKQ